jgi:DNA primase
MPTGKDPDDAAREDAAAFKKAIQQAVPVYDYFLSSVVSRFDPSGVYGKKKISEEFLPVLSKIENQIVQGHYVRRLAEALGVTEETVTESLAKVRRTGTSRQFSENPEVQEKKVTREEKLEMYLLALLLQGKTKEWLEELLEHLAIHDFLLPSVVRIVGELSRYAHATPVYLLKDFVDGLPKELVPTVDEAYLWDLSEVLGSEELLEREWTDALKEFRKLVLRRKINQLSREAAEDATTRNIDTAHGPKTLQDLALELRGLEKPGSI